ncbi:MAG TPA: hypothetical protein VL001_11620 [Candidimonas sp.]|nr:hypothetical protein [Candidimonas sp.]
MAITQDTPLTFTADELDLLGRTADALSAYMGKPVLAEVIDAEETGFEWVIFAVPLDIQDNPADIVLVQVGGPGAKILGNQGGLDLVDGEVYDCEYLWSIQLSDLEGVRFIKVDTEGEEIAWTANLHDILPFAMSDTPPPDDDIEDEDPDDDSDEGGDFNLPRGDPPHTLH